jgi:hypothetical protein
MVCECGWGGGGRFRREKAGSRPVAMQLPATAGAATSCGVATVWTATAQAARAPAPRRNTGMSTDEPRRCFMCWTCTPRRPARLGPCCCPADEGIVDVRAHSVSLVGEPRVLHRDATSGAATGAPLWGLGLGRGSEMLPAGLRL